jgi:hypothetical protein
VCAESSIPEQRESEKEREREREREKFIAIKK